MKIAVVNDYPFEMAFAHREGIAVHTSHLCRALLAADPALHIEFWQYSFNTPHMQRAYKLAVAAYPSRVSFHDEGGISLWRRGALFFVRGGFRILKSLFRISAPTLRDKLKQKVITPALERVIKKHAKASAFYVPHVRLPMAARLEGVTLMQVHDLFTLTLRDVFAKDWDDIDASNANVLENLASYVEGGAYFISSTEYTKKEILKYLPQVSSEAIIPISIPPMIGSFTKISGDRVAAVKHKYGINKPYTFMASQNRPNKNWGGLLKALAQLRDEGIDLTMVTTGRIADIKQCAKLQSQLKLGEEVIETGALPAEDLAALYKGAAMVVVPTMIEGYGMSGQGLEGMTMGVPVIHSKSLGIEESLASVGLSFETADLNWFGCDDATTLAQKIKDVLATPLPHVQKQKHILEAYTSITWEDTAREYLKLFERGTK